MASRRRPGRRVQAARHGRGQRSIRLGEIHQGAVSSSTEPADIALEVETPGGRTSVLQSARSAPERVRGEEVATNVFAGRGACSGAMTKSAAGEDDRAYCAIPGSTRWRCATRLPILPRPIFSTGSRSGPRSRTSARYPDRCRPGESSPGRSEIDSCVCSIVRRTTGARGGRLLRNRSRRACPPRWAQISKPTRMRRLADRQTRALHCRGRNERSSSCPRVPMQLLAAAAAQACVWSARPLAEGKLGDSSVDIRRFIVMVIR